MLNKFFCVGSFRQVRKIRQGPYNSSKSYTDHRCLLRNIFLHPRELNPTLPSTLSLIHLRKVFVFTVLVFLLSVFSKDRKVLGPREVDSIL